ncbi:MAG: PIG-L family deacetylase [Acidimicrobiales bacterium]
MATITFFHAHPDDEAIATGGTMADLAHQGHKVVLVTATRGELGEIPDGLLAPGESLADRRASELAEAGRILGVSRQSFLDYHDSGMAGEESNNRPGCFAAADPEEAAEALAAILDEEASDALVIYDEHGGYGHPDHIQVHRVGMRAAVRAGTSVVYMATMDRDFFQELRQEVVDSDLAPPGDEPDEEVTMGEPADRITTEVDVARWIETKRQAMRAHASQIGEGSFFLSMPDDLFTRVWGQEWYIRVRPEPMAEIAGRREPALLLPPEPTNGPVGAASGTGGVR